MDIKDLQEIQRQLDKTYWPHRNLPDPEKIKHVALHMGELVKKLSTYCEQCRYGYKASLTEIRKEVIPNLLSHSLRLSNLLNEEIEPLYQNRLTKLKEKLKS